MSIKELTGKKCEVVHFSTSETKSLGERRGKTATILDAWTTGLSAKVLVQFDEDGRLFDAEARHVLIHPAEPANNSPQSELSDEEFRKKVLAILGEEGWLKIASKTSEVIYPEQCDSVTIRTDGEYKSCWAVGDDTPNVAAGESWTMPEWFWKLSSTQAKALSDHVLSLQHEHKHIEFPLSVDLADEPSQTAGGEIEKDFVFKTEIGGLPAGFSPSLQNASVTIEEPLPTTELKIATHTDLLQDGGVNHGDCGTALTGQAPEPARPDLHSFVEAVSVIAGDATFTNDSPAVFSSPAELEGISPIIPADTAPVTETSQGD